MFLNNPGMSADLEATGRPVRSKREVSSRWAYATATQNGAAWDLVSPWQPSQQD